MILDHRYVKGPEANVTGMDPNIEKKKRRNGTRRGSVFNKTSKISRKYKL